MIWIDYVIIGIVIFSILISIIRGFIREILSLLTWICAFFTASHYYEYFSIYLTNFKNQLVRNSVTIILMFIIILFIGSIVNYIIGLLIKKTGLSSTDRVLGACFGVIRGILIVLILLSFLDIFNNVFYSQEYQYSKLILKLNNIIKQCINYLNKT